VLTEEDKKAIAETIKRAETGTSGEIVFAITESCGSYRFAALTGAIIGMAICTAANLLIPIIHTINMVLWVELVSFLIFYAIFQNTSLRRWFIPIKELDSQTQEAAFMEFYGKGLYRTRDANGVLIFLSLFEREVVVIGDKGIHEKLGNQNWDDVRNRIIDGIKTGKAREGICAAIESCGNELAKYFPVKPDDTNEIPNDVIVRPSK
jgi:putative membrane protein